MDDQQAWFYYKKLTPEEAKIYKDYLEDRSNREKDDKEGKA